MSTDEEPAKQPPAHVGHIHHLSTRCDELEDHVAELEARLAQLEDGE